MPTNIYNPFTGGTWEIYPFVSEAIDGGELMTGATITGQPAHSSSRSGWIRNLGGRSGLIGPGSLELFSNGSGGIRIQPLTSGVRYKLSAWVYVSSDVSFPQIGTDNMPIAIGAFDWRDADGNVLPSFYTDVNIVATTIADATDTWVQVSFEFTYDGSTNYGGFGNRFNVSAFDADSYDSTYPFFAKLLSETGLSPAGTELYLGDGSLFVDDVRVDEVPVCDIAWDGPPYYTKTDCTANGADDGTITLVGITSSYYLQYSLDEITWQGSPIFTGLAPGTYTAYARDTNPAACDHLSISGITITEPAADTCDLTYTGTTKTNETGTGLNDGTALIGATSSFSPEVSINNVNWFAAPHNFTGLAPGSYTIYLRDSNPTGCSFSPGTFEILAFGAVITGSMTGNWLNRYNFIQFRTFSGVKEFNAVSRGCDDLEDQLPNPFRIRDKDFAFEKNERHYPVICPNEIFTFYFNFIGGLTDPEWSIYKIAIANYQGIVLDNIGTIQKVDIDSTHYNIYSDDCQVSSLPIGIYFIVIYKDDELLYASNEIQLLTLNNTDLYFNAKYVTVRAQWKNLNNIYGYLWALIPDFAMKLRLKLYQIDTQFEGVFEQYSEVSTGVKRNDNVELSKYYVMQMYYADDIGQDAMGIWQINTTLVLNNVTYITKSGYKITYDPRMQVNVGQIELYDQEFSSINKGGRPGGITPTPEIGFLEGDFEGLIKL